MPRPQKCRRICQAPRYDCFHPKGKPDAAVIVLTLDEYEVIRLVDFEKRTHEQCALQMNVSRTTITEIYESARFKLADSIVNGKSIEIAGGSIQLCDGSASACCGRPCKIYGCESAPSLNQKGENTMRIAVTYENDNIFQHFGHSSQFKIYDIEDGKIVKAEVVDTNGSGHGALAGFLVMQRADAVICGGIGGGAQMALARMGIQLYGGCVGNCDEAVLKLIEGKLDFNPDVRCDHHDHAHDESHSCGEHGCHDHGEGECGCH